MPSGMERLLGGKIGRDERKLRGTGDGESPESIRLVSFTPGSRRGYEKVIRAVSPLIPKSGGVVLGDNVRTPDGMHFYILELHGDVPGWRRQIEAGAESLGLTTARIDGDRLSLSDGRSFLIEDCILEAAPAR